MQITSQLIEATSGGHLWAERFDRDLTDIFAVQDDVTQHIVTALALALSEGDRQRLLTEHTDNLEAYDLFLRGRELWWRQTKEANVKARELLQRASKSDPSFAPAFAFLRVKRTWSITLTVGAPCAVEILRGRENPATDRSARRTISYRPLGAGGRQLMVATNAILMPQPA